MAKKRAKRIKHKGATGLAKKKESSAAVAQRKLRLTALAASIVKRAKNSQAIADSMTQELIETGRELAEAQSLLSKQGVKGEGFYKWVQQNCKFGRSSAYNYIRLFRASDKFPKKLLGVDLKEAYILAGIRQATGGPAPGGSAPGGDTPQLTLRDIKLAEIVPSADNKTRSLSLSRADGFQFTLQLPTDRIEEYAKTGRSELVKHFREALDQFLEEQEEKTKPGDAKVARAGEAAVKVKDGK